MAARARRLGIIGTLCAALIGGAPTADAAETGSATCQAPGVAWRVDYEITPSGYGPILKATGFLRRALPSGAWTDAGAQTWQLRWEHLADAWDNPFSGPHKQEEGDLARLRTIPVAVYLSARFVPPGGECTVYTAPFANGTNGQPKIGVLGDSLTGSLNDSSYNQQHLQGYVQGNLNAAGLRTEVEGQGGRRWVALPDLTGLGKADSYLLDEYRGLLQHDPRGYVVALGANDAGWIALAPDEQERQARLASRITGIRAILDEMRTAGKCVTFVTGPDNLANYWGADPWAYAWAAQSINTELRAQANASATDVFKLQDFAAQSWNHHTWDPDNWFATDDLHLNGAGKLVYTAAITQAAQKCV